MLIDDLHFRETLEEAKKVGNNWAIATSGGSDSLGLFFAIREYIEKNLLYIKLHIITVNHNLRPEVVKEIDFLSSLTEHHDVKFTILNWEHHNQFTHNLYDNARKNRYKLLIEYCKSQNIEVLFTAHHLEDQIETFKIRLKKSIGVEGLSCIRSRILYENITILRPFLEINPAKIRQYLSEKNQLWIEEKTNYNTTFTRAKIRRQSKKYSVETIHDDIFGTNISSVTKKIFLANEALEFYSDSEYKKIVNMVNNRIHVNAKHFTAIPIEISLRILKKIFITAQNAKRILFFEVLNCRKQMLKLLFCEKDTLQFSNFVISYTKDCFIFEEMRQKK